MWHTNATEKSETVGVRSLVLFGMLDSHAAKSEKKHWLKIVGGQDPVRNME